VVGGPDARPSSPAHDPAPLAVTVDSLAGSRRYSPDGRREALADRFRARHRPRITTATRSALCDPRPTRRSIWRGTGTRHATLDAVEISNVTRSFIVAKRPLVALEGISFAVTPGSIVAVVGPNGSGKSTLLRVVSGLLPPESGEVRIDGSPVTGPDPRVGLVFQQPRLLPWRTVIDNVAFPLELAGQPRGRREARARELLQRVGLSGFEHAHPGELSGGMAQRVGIARALALDPQVLLLDEPFGALDSLTRDRLNQELLRLWELTGSTIVLVTHSIPEAVFLADRVLVLSPQPGRLVADVAVDLPRPRAALDVDGAAFSRAAAAVRSALAEGASQVAEFSWPARDDEALDRQEALA